MQNILNEDKLASTGLAKSEMEIEIEHPTEGKDFGLNSVLKFGTDFKYLFLEQVLQMRTTWFYTLCLSVVFPLLTLFGFTRVGGSVTNAQSLIYIIAGSSVYSMVLEGLYTVSQKMANLKQIGRFVYYASLPITKFSLVAALLFSRLLIIGLPGMLTPLLLGSVFYNIALSPTIIWAIIILPLTALSLAVPGMCLGLMFESTELVNVVATVGSFLILLASPVFIPAASLPLPLQILGYLLPTTYAADALRQCLSGALSASFYWDGLILLTFVLASGYGINKYLRWRI